MFWTILGVLLVLWLLGFIFKVAGGLIHLLLLLAVIILVVRLIMYLVDA
ncbi:MAG TPA: lmo0937 family membrane protein [Pseudogracilibacillus sp.]|nr:lmo0937 family membrane protein [Pseudogracilibacillus sp.]